MGFTRGPYAPKRSTLIRCGTCDVILSHRHVSDERLREVTRGALDGHRCPALITTSRWGYPLALDEMALRERIEDRKVRR